MALDRKTLARPVLGGSAVAAGQVVTIDTGALIPLVGATNQAGTVSVKPAGIALTSATSTTECATCYEGSCMALAGDTIAVGDILVAKYQTARVIPFVDSAYTDGTVVWTVGRALEGASDGQMVRIETHITSRAIATAPA